MLKYDSYNLRTVIDEHAVEQSCLTFIVILINNIYYCKYGTRKVVPFYKYMYTYIIITFGTSAVMWALVAD